MLFNQALNILPQNVKLRRRWDSAARNDVLPCSLAQILMRWSYVQCNLLHFQLGVFCMALVIGLSSIWISNSCTIWYKEKRWFSLFSTVGSMYTSGTYTRVLAERLRESCISIPFLFPGSESWLRPYTQYDVCSLKAPQT